MDPETRRKRVEEIFSAAAELPRADRDAFLQGKCGSDGDLRAEIESLLAYDAPDGQWISALVEDAAASVLVGDLLPGSHVGPYRVLREIGRGGMGTVCLAERDDHAYQKQVAIKLVKRGMDIDAVVDRFRHERRILARLDHPNIAKLLDAGTAPDGRPYFVMEYVEGLRITDYCRQRELTVEQRCELFRQVCDAVGYAHRALVIHRDLKPGNILVGDDGIPKLLDFGIAKVLSEGGEGEALTLTVAAARMGTPEYASPEQIRGEAVTTAGDVYSLGVLLYELLTGERPYSLDTLTPAELERAICQDDPARPSTLAGKRLRSRTTAPAAHVHRPPSRVGADLDNIVLMAMRKEPERRYHSADELSEDVRRYLTGLPVRARGQKFSYRAGKFLRRHRLIVLAAGAAALSLIVGAAVAIREARVADAQRQRAERRLQQMVELANHSLFDIHDTLEKLPGATEARREIVKTTLDFLDKLRRDGDNDPALSAALASAYMRIGDVQGRPGRANLGDSQGALASYGHALEIYQPLAKLQPGDNALARRLLEVEIRMAAMLEGLNRDPEARTLLGEAIPPGEKLASRNPGDRDLAALLGQAYLEIANLTVEQTPEQSIERVRKAAALFGKLAAGHPEDRELLDQLAGSYYILAESIQHDGGLASARDALQKAIDVWERLWTRYPNDAVLRRRLMKGYTTMGDLYGRSSIQDPRLAAAYFRKVVAMAEAAAKADSKDMEARLNLSEALFRLGYAMNAPGDRADSIEILRRAVAIAEGTHQLDSANAGYCMTASYANRRLGERLQQAGDSAAALAAYARARALARQLVNAEPGNQAARGALAESDKYTADLLAQSGDRAAIGYMLHADAQVDAALKLGGGIWVLVYKPRCQRWLGDIYAVLARGGSGRASGQDDWKNARAAYARALEGYRALPGKERFAREMSETQRLLADCDKRLR
jgi:serine/threonine protein kinase